MMNPEDIARVVKKANANATLMDGSDDTVMKIITENDVVWGVWQDATQRDGVGLHLIKGRHALKITPANSITDHPGVGNSLRMPWGCRGQTAGPWRRQGGWGGLNTRARFADPFKTMPSGFRIDKGKPAFC